VRVLVVDDELLIRWSIAETLTEAGHEVVEAGDAATALEVMVKEPPPDVVVLDYRLPDSDDLGLLGKIRRLAPAAVVIMMTAFGTPEMTHEAFELGAREVVNKPFNMHDLAAKLRSLSRPA
jgi:DNA-binding response OmpR family regulator